MDDEIKTGEMTGEIDESITVEEDFTLLEGKAVSISDDSDNKTNEEEVYEEALDIKESLDDIRQQIKDKLLDILEKGKITDADGCEIELLNDQYNEKYNTLKDLANTVIPGGKGTSIENASTTDNSTTEIVKINIDYDEILKTINEKADWLYIDEDGQVMLNGEVVPKLKVVELEAEKIKADVGEFKDLTTENFKATNAEIENLKANKADIEYLTANYATIENLNATNANVSNLQATKANITDLNAVNAEINNLKADKADITDLNAVNAEIKNLKADKADVEDLTAVNAEIENLKANKADIDTLNANVATINQALMAKATVGDLNAANAKIANLEANKADIEVLEANYATIEALDANVANINTALIDKANVSDLNATKAIVEDLKTSKADIADLTAVNAKITNLEAGKADVAVLEANYATIKQLDATNANVTSLQTETANINKALINKADVADLNATNAKVTDLQATKANVSDLNAAKANISTLTSDLADITTLVNGNLTSDNIQSMVITGEKFTVADGFIKNAMIDSVNANKINAGSINTNNVTIQSNDGSMVLQGNLQQFKDKNGKVRIQIGKDAAGNFTFVLYDENGTGQLINQNGIQSSNAIADGLIVDSKVADNANIAGSKLDIDSVVTEVNNGSTSIKGTKIYLDDQKQSLNVAFNNMTNTVKGNTSTLNNHTTSINTMNGKVTQLISDTTITKENGTTVSLKDAYNTTVDTVNSHSTKIGSLETNLSTANNNISSVSSKQAALEQNLNGFKQTVSDTYATKAEFNNLEIGGTNLIANSAPKSTSGWQQYAGRSGSWTLSLVDCSSSTYGKAIRATSNNAAAGGLHKQPIDYTKLVKNEYYTISAWIRASKNCTANFINEYMQHGNIINITTEWKYYSYTDKLTGNGSHSDVIYISSGIENGMWIEVHSLKLEKGTKSSSWSPAPQDIDSAISTVDGKLANYSTTSQMNSAINQKANEITSTVSETYATKASLTTVDNKFANYSTTSAMNSAINQKSDAILSTVSKTYATQTSLADVSNNLKNNYSTTSAMNSAINQKANEITSSVSKTYATKASVTDVSNNLKNNYSTTSAMNSAINQKANEITSSVSETYATKKSVSDVSNNLKNNYSTTSAMNSAINQKANEITSSVSETYATKTSLKATDDKFANYSTTSQMNSAINQKGDSILSTVSNTYTTKADFNNLEIGGRNLLRKADLSKRQTTGNFDAASNTWTLTATAGSGDILGCGLSIINGNVRTPYGKTCMISFEILSPRAVTVNWDVNNYAVSGSSWAGNDNDTLSNRKNSSKSIPANQWTKCWFSYTNTHGSNTNKVDLYDNSVFGVVMKNETSNLTFKIRNVKAELGTTPTAWTPAPEDIDASIATVDGKFANYSTTSQMNSAINQKANEITSTVSNTYATKTALNTVDGKFADYSTTSQMNSAINQKSDSILSTVSKTYATKTSVSDVSNNLKNNYSTTTAMNSAINQKANEITSSVSETYATKTALNTVDGKFANYSTTSAMNSAINQKSDAILSTVSSTYATKTALKTTDDKFANYSTTSQMNSAINQKSDSILSTVSKTYTTKADFNNLTLGGTNLIANSAPKSTSGWSPSSGWTTSLVDCSAAPYGKAIRATNNSGTSGSVHKPPIDHAKCVNGEYYTISAWIRASKSCKISFMNEMMTTGNTIDITTSWKYYTFTSKINTGATYHSNTFYVTRDTIASGMWLEIHSLKLEKGTKPSSWTPAPEDIDSAISTVDGKFANYSTTSQMNSAINQKANEITSTVSNTYATKTALNTVDGKFANYSTTSAMNTAINQKSDSILSTVSSTYATKTALNTVDGKFANYSTTSQMNSAINQKGDSILSTVSNTYTTKADFNGLDIGGNNILPFSSIGNYQLNPFSTDKQNFTITGTHTNTYSGITINPVPYMAAGQKGILQFKIKKNSGTLTVIGCHVDSVFSVTKALVDGVSRPVISPGSNSWGIDNTNWHQVIIYFTYKGGTPGGPAMCAQPNRALDTTVNVTYKDIKIEIGNKPSAWSPCIKDIQGDIATVDGKFANYSTTNQMNSAINQKANEITSSVSNTYATKAALNTVDGKFANYSTTTAMNTAINQKADSITQSVSNTYATKTSLNTANNNITSLTNRMSSAESKLTKDSLTTTIGKYYTTTTDVNGIITSKNYATTSQLQQTATDLTATFNDGYNQGITQINKDGIKVLHNSIDSNSYTHMAPSGFYIKNKGTDIFKVDTNGLYFKGKAEITSGSMPSSLLTGTIDNARLNSTIVNGANNGTSAKSTLDSKASGWDSTKSTVDSKAGGWDSTKSTVDGNKTNWSNAYNRVVQWASGAVTGSTTINGGMIATNTILANKIALTDFTNYAQLNKSSAGAWGFTTTDDKNGVIYTVKAISRDTFISEAHTCNGGETFRIKGAISTTCKGRVDSSATSDSYLGTAIGLYQYNGSGGSVTISYSNRVTGSSGGAWTNFDATVTLNSNARQFRVFLQTNGVSNFSGTIKVRNIQVIKMSSAELIVDGAVTAGKIAANAVTSDKVAANAIVAGKIAAGAITADKIASNAVTAVKIAAGAVTADKLSANSVTADKIAAGAITANKLSADAITGKTIIGGTINGTEVTGGSFNVEGQLTANRIVCQDIDNARYPATLDGDIELYVNSSTGNDDNEPDDDVRFKTLQGAIDAMPKFLNGKTVYITMETDSTEDVYMRGFVGGAIRIYMNGKTLYGTLRSYVCAASINVYGGTKDSTEGATGIIHPNIGLSFGSRAVSVGFEASQYAAIYKVKVYAPDTIPSDVSNTDKVCIASQAGTGSVYCKNIEIVNAVIGFRSNNHGSMHVNSSSGVASKYGFQAVTGGIISMANNNQAGGKTANTNKNSGGQVWYDSNGPKFATGNQTTDGGTAPVAPNTKTLTIKSSYGDTYRSTVYNSWKRDGSVRGGDYGYGDCNGCWFFGSAFSEVKGKTISKVEITITRNSGGKSSAVGLVVKSHGYSGRPSGAPTYRTTAGTLSLATGATGKLTITNSTILNEIKSGTVKGFGIQNTYDSNNYAVCSGSCTVKITYTE